MSSNKIITIMIPVYNSYSFIIKCLESVSILPEFIEVIVLDDYSTDDTFKIAKYYQNKYGKINVFRNEKNFGRNYTYRKLLYELAKTDWVLMLDGDDYLVGSDFFNKAVQVLKNYDNLVAIIGGYIKYRDRSIYRIPKEEYYDKGIEVTLKYPNITYSHGAVLYNRKKAMEIGFYRLGIPSDDLESHLRLFCEGGVYFINEIVYTWRIHDTNETLKLTYNQYLYNIKTMTDSVCIHLISKGLNKKKVFKWRNNCLSKLYIIALFSYGVKEHLGIRKIFFDILKFLEIKPIFIFKNYLLVSIIIYLILPKFVILRLLRIVRKI